MQFVIKHQMKIKARAQHNKHRKVKPNDHLLQSLEPITGSASSWGRLEDGSISTEPWQGAISVTVAISAYADIVSSFLTESCLNYLSSCLKSEWCILWCDSVRDQCVTFWSLIMQLCGTRIFWIDCEGCFAFVPSWLLDCWLFSDLLTLQFVVAFTAESNTANKWTYLSWSSIVHWKRQVWMVKNITSTVIISPHF